MVESHSHTSLKSIIPYDEHNHFPLENIPFGAFVNPKTNETHCCTRIGDLVIDLAVLNSKFDGPLFSKLEENVFKHQHLNKFMELGKDHWHEARVTIQKLFSQDEGKIDEDTLKEISF